MQPEAAIDSWRQWGGSLSTRPAIVNPLSGGLNNRSYLLDSGNRKLVLRINNKPSVLTGISRNKEARIWQAASDEGIAPLLIHIDEQDRFLVSEYINSELPQRPELDPSIVDQALLLLERCHQIKIETPAIDYFKHFESYWRIIENKTTNPNPILHRQRLPMQKLLQNLLNSNTPTGLCHHDPVITNFVGTPRRLYLIDWEYACHGLQVMDYAALAVEWDIGNSIICNKAGVDPGLLKDAKTIYSYLRAVWRETVN